MLKTFNYGSGFAIFLPDSSNAQKTVSIAKQLGYNAIEAGEILPCSSGRQLIVEPLNVELNAEQFLLQKT